MRLVLVLFVIFGALAFIGGIGLALERKADEEGKEPLPVAYCLAIATLGVIGAVAGVAAREGHRAAAPAVYVFAAPLLLGFPIGTIVAYCVFTGLSKYFESVERVERAGRRQARGRDYEEDEDDEEDASRRRKRLRAGRDDEDERDTPRPGASSKRSRRGGRAAEEDEDDEEDEETRPRRRGQSRSRQGMSPWVWALAGVGVVVLIVGLMALGVFGDRRRGGNAGQGEAHLEVVRTSATSVRTIGGHSFVLPEDATRIEALIQELQRETENLRTLVGRLQGLGQPPESQMERLQQEERNLVDAFKILKDGAAYLDKEMQAGHIRPDLAERLKAGMSAYQRTVRDWVGASRQLNVPTPAF